MNEPGNLCLSQRFPPVVTFAPLAWLKLQYFCHAGPTEIGGFGIARADQPLYLEEFITVRQHVSPVSVRFVDDAIADYFDRCTDRGLSPQCFARVWCHTHPGASVTPSSTDEETFLRSFGRCDWALMFILGRTGRTYARLAFTAGPGAALELPVTVDWSAWPDSLNRPWGVVRERWQQEYAAHIELAPASTMPRVGPREERPWWEEAPWDPALDEVFYAPVPRRENS
ncbi:MAG: hypothetical protein K2R98_31715 [Gemmataceae bacterium]|nr:hypothetical protein [Gemmataceae bacterium]